MRGAAKDAAGTARGGFLRTRVGFWSVYLVFTALFVVSAVEAIVRLAGLAPKPSTHTAWLVQDPHLPYKPRPLSVMSGRSSTDEYDFHHEHNSLGFRDVEHAVEKPPGVFRILGLGDSFTSGWGASFEATYLSRLEHALNQRPGDHPTVEIIKAGINGYFPESEKLLLEHYGLQFDPDLVLVGFTPNDLLDTHRGLSAIQVSKRGYLTSREAKGLGEFGVWLFLHSHSARIVLKKYVETKNKVLPDDWWMEMYRQDGLYEDSWREIGEQYEEMSRLVERIGARLVILHIPGSPPLQEFHTYPSRRLGQWCAERQIEYIDALPALKEAAESEPLYYKIDPHCTPAGYRVIAETLLQELTGRGLVP